jgi:hypothetical protein
MLHGNHLTHFYKDGSKEDWAKFPGNDMKVADAGWVWTYERLH